MTAAPFTYRATVRYSHKDPSATVYFPRFFEFVQAAAEDWFTIGVGIPFADMIRERGMGQPTAHLECDFTAPSFLGDVLDIAVYLVKIGRSSFELNFVGEASGEPRFTARSVQVMVSFEDGKPIPLPGDIRAAMEAYMSAVDAPVQPRP